jgi:polysaccharide chain length determinant protein (PEP-CTERM system associated)
MENESNSGASFGEYWTVVKRRIWWFIVPFVLSIPIGVWIAIHEPKLYGAEATILIDTPDMPEEYMMEPGNIEVRLSKIRQEILDRDHARKIIEDFDLYHDQVVKTGITDKMIDNFQDSVSIDTMSTSITTGRRGQKSLTGFVISVDGRDPKAITDIANHLAQVIVDKNQVEKEKFVKSTSTFLDTEVDNLKAKLEAQEKKISDFKREYMGELPEQLGANLRLKEKYQQDLSSTMDELKQLEEKKKFLETQLTEVTVNQSDPTSLENRISHLKEKLLALRGVFKENYPDVIATKQEIALLESLMAGTEKDQAPDSKTEGKDSKSPENPQDSPVYSKVQNEIYSTDLDIKALNERITELTRLVNLYQERVDKAPVREQELLSLMRDYDNTQNRYKSLLDKKLTAEISENMQRQVKEGEFRIYDPARIPEKPYAPDVFKLVMTFIGYGAALGAGLLLLVEYTDTSFHSVQDLEKSTGHRVLCTIPKFTPEQLKEVTNWSRKRIPPSVLINDSQSLAAEQYRILCGKIQQHFKGSSGKTIGLTSAILGEGKSTTAMNLAVAFGLDFKKKTLLIDADLHKVGSAWINKEGPGLTEVLAGKAGLESALIGIPSYNLTVLPKGNIGKVNPVEILGTEGFQNFLEQVKGFFEFIVVDCPPVLQVASTNLVVESLDTMLMVVKADHTPRALVLKAEAAIHNQNIMGIVFNHASQSELPSKYYYYTTSTYSHV